MTPSFLKNVVGHQTVKDRFAVALNRDRLPSTFLFVGPEGIGKKTFAIALAKALLCESNDSSSLEACGQCEGCTLMDAGNHPDFELVQKRKDKAYLLIEQFIGVKDRRNQEGMCHNISLTPFRGGRKIAVIDDADFFNQESANCLLKTLEEPPPRSVLIMIGTSEQKQLSTIRSRSQIVHFHPLSTDEVKQVLNTLDTSEIEASSDEMAQQSSGSLQVLQQYREEGLLDFKSQFLSKLASCETMTQGFPKELIGFVDQAGKDAAKRRQRLRLLADFAIQFYRYIALHLAGSTHKIPHSYLRPVQDAIKNWKSDAEAATECVERCMDVHLQIAANANQATLIEAWLSDLGKLSRGDEAYENIKVTLAY